MAWVYDPHTDEEGCFGWIGGNIEKLSAIRVGYSQQVEMTGAAAHEFEDDDDGGVFDPMVSTSREQKSAEPVWMKWITRAVLYLAGMVLGFVLCFFFLNWRWAPVFEQAERYGQLIEALRQFDEQHPGVLGLRNGDNSNGFNQQPPQQPQQAPQQKAPEARGNNGKH